MFVITCFGLCAAARIAFFPMSESGYYEISEGSRWPLLLCSVLGILLALLLPRGSQG